VEFNFITGKVNWFATQLFCLGALLCVAYVSNV